MIAHIRKTNRSAAKSRRLLLLALLALPALFPHSAWGQEQRVEVSTDYSYLRANSSGGGGSFNALGGSATAVWNVKPWLGLAADFAGYHFEGQPASVDARMFTYTFGPRFSPRMGHGPLHFFGQFLLGGTTLSASLTGQHAGENGFAIMAGGGVDARVQTHLAIRCVEVDYLMTRYDRTVGTTGYQNDVRISTGLVFRFDIDRK
jgi:hypothetical protein